MRKNKIDSVKRRGRENTENIEYSILFIVNICVIFSSKRIFVEQVKFQAFLYLKRVYHIRRVYTAMFASYISGCVRISCARDNNILYLYFRQRHISMRYTYCKYEGETRNNSPGG